MSADAASRGDRDEGARAGERPGAPGTDVTRELVLRAQCGDRTAFAGIYERYVRVVHGVLVAHAPWRDVHDLAQDVFVRALRSIDTLEDPDQLGPWLLTIARNRARDHLKRGRREVEVPDVLDVAEREPASDDDDAARAVLALIRELPESYRETLVLRLVEGLPGPEIARRTGLTHGSVRVNLFRGMKLLRERLARDARRGTS